MIYETAEQVRLLCRLLLDYSGPVGLDTETLYWSPKDKRSPVGRAKLWCITLAWGRPSLTPPSDFATAMVFREHVGELKPWLESEAHRKVTTNGLGFERHVFDNEKWFGDGPINIRGIEMDTDHASRLLNPDKTYGHDLKNWMQRMGYPDVVPFKELVTVVKAVPGKEAAYKKVGRARTKDGTPRLVGGEYQKVSWTKVQVELDELWERYPEKREQIMRYAIQDACGSLDARYALLGRMRD